MMGKVNREEYDPIYKDKTDDWLKLHSSLWGWIFGYKPALSWHGDIRLFCTEERYQELTDAGPSVQKREKFGRMRIAVESEALDEYRKQFDAWLGRPNYFNDAK